MMEKMVVEVGYFCEEDGKVDSGKVGVIVVFRTDEEMEGRMVEEW